MVIEARSPGRPPSISDRYRYREAAGRWHNGVDLGYRRDVELDDDAQNENQSRRYDIWPGTAIVATGPGRVTFAKPTRSVGGLVAIRHRGNLQTRYVHLERIDVAKGDEVELGQVLGTAVRPRRRTVLKSPGGPREVQGTARPLAAAYARDSRTDLGGTL